MFNNCDCRCNREHEDKSMCDRNPKHEKFEKVVATWQTVRHYDVHSYDTIKPICTDGLREKCFEKCVEDKCKRWD